MRIGSVLLAVGVAGGVALWLAAGPAEAPADRAAAAKPDAEAAERAPTLVETRRVKPEALVDFVRLRGSTEADRKVSLRAETAGRVISDPSRKGAKIAKGAILCEVETGERGARLSEARARLAQAETDANVSGKLKRRGFSGRHLRGRRHGGARERPRRAGRARARSRTHQDRRALRRRVGDRRRRDPARC